MASRTAKAPLPMPMAENGKRGQHWKMRDLRSELIICQP